MKINSNIILAAFALVFAVFAAPLHAQIPIPYADGSDGALNLTSGTNLIDLRLAVNGVWTNNDSANAGNGIYDSNQWAIIFKYTYVNIASNVVVIFTNHPSRAPVVWLVSNGVTNNGEINLDGQPATSDPVNLPEPGPGGFRGGAEGQATLGYSGGFGPGGYYNDFGSYSTHNPYGNPQIIPLIGGSGGSAGDYGYPTCINGTAGGGAILIAASGTILVNGYCHADGNNAGQNTAYDFNGSGGAIRLVANQILGTGRIEATSGAYPGRIRLEANTVGTSLNLDPLTVGVAPASPVVIFPATNAPTVTVVSVSNLPAPADPRAQMTSAGDDLTLATTNTVAIVLQTANFPITGTVNVYIKPRNAPQSILQASYVSGTTNLATWQLNTVLPLSHFIIQARAVSN